MDVEVLDALADREEWYRVLDMLPVSLRDAYYRPEYVGLYHFEPGARAVLFTYRRGGEAWAYPFILRPIECVGQHRLSAGWYDVETAYGYGGPVATTEDARFLKEAHTAFTEWCSQQAVVAEFVRVHPLLPIERWMDPNVELAYDRETVSIRLAALDGDAFPLEKNARYMLRRAERLGVHVARHPVLDNIDHFAALYNSTMDRLGVDEYYYFGDEYFRSLAEIAEEAGMLLAAEKDGAWVGAAIFLTGGALLHYHLSVSDPQNRIPGATNLLLYVAAQQGLRGGLERLHLGGGNSGSPDDSLLRFKRSMSTDSHRFFVGRRVHDEHAYAALREAWEERYPSLVPTYGNRLLCYRYGRTQ